MAAGQNTKTTLHPICDVPFCKKNLNRKSDIVPMLLEYKVNIFYCHAVGVNTVIKQEECSLYKIIVATVNSMMVLYPLLHVRPPFIDTD